jgi:hypothetical protein
MKLGGKGHEEVLKTSLFLLTLTVGAGLAALVAGRTSRRTPQTHQAERPPAAGSDRPERSGGQRTADES